jgi:hypothetical protein
LRGKSKARSLRGSSLWGSYILYDNVASRFSEVIVHHSVYDSSILVSITTIMSRSPSSHLDSLHTTTSLPVSASKFRSIVFLSYVSQTSSLLVSLEGERRRERMGHTRHTVVVEFYVNCCRKGVLERGRNCPHAGFLKKGFAPMQVLRTVLHKVCATVKRLCLHILYASALLLI